MRVNVLDVAFALHSLGKLDLRIGANLGLNALGRRVLGSFDLASNRLCVDAAVGTDGPRFRFVLAHELGHFVLHRKLSLDWSRIDEPASAINDNWRHVGIHVLRRTRSTDRDWLEWQANTFAASLLMPAADVASELRIFHDKHTVRRPGTVFLDDQPENFRAFGKTVDHLAACFEASRTTTIYRMRALGLLVDQRQGTAATWIPIQQALSRDDIRRLLEGHREGDTD
jgi:Zn-dependent peptidase ImmA (M78 family)